MNDLSKWNFQPTTIETETSLQDYDADRSVEDVDVERSRLDELAEIAKAWLKAEKRNQRILGNDYVARISELLEQLDRTEVKFVRELFKSTLSKKN